MNLCLDACCINFLRKLLLFHSLYRSYYKGGIFTAIFSDPFIGNIPRQMSPEELCQALRVDIAGELEAIVGYESHANATDNQNAKQVLFHIADEERRHVGMLQALLYSLLPKSKQFVEQGNNGQGG